MRGYYFFNIRILSVSVKNYPYPVAYLPLGHLGHAPPPLELGKNLAYGKKMQPKCAIFRQKSLKVSGEGAQASPDRPPQTYTPTG